MTNPMNSLLFALAADADLDPRLELRLCESAVRTKDRVLIETLAERHDLSEEAAQVLQRSGNPHVIGLRAMALVNAGRITELHEMLRKEKRVAVSARVAATENLPQEVYRALLDGARQRTLIALAENATVEEATKIEAVKHLLSAYASRIDQRIDERVRVLMLDIPGIGDAVMTRSLGPTVWTFALDHCPVSSEGRRRCGLLLSEELEESAGNFPPPPHSGGLGFAYQALPQRHQALVRCARTLSLRPLPADAREAMIDALARYADAARAKKHTPKLMVHLTDIQQAFESTAAGDGRTLEDRFTAAESVEELGTLAIGGGALTNPELIALLENPHFDQSVADRIRLGWYQMRQIAGQLRQPSVGAIALIVSRFPWASTLDELLTRVGDPAMVLVELSHRCPQHSSVSEAVLTSVHLDDAVLGKLPVHWVQTRGLPSRITQMLADRLVQSAASHELWETLMGVGAQFEGTLEELLEVATTL